jgi:hypothetical protein
MTLDRYDYEIPPAECAIGGRRWLLRGTLNFGLIARYRHRATGGWSGHPAIGDMLYAARQTATLVAGW